MQYIEKIAMIRLEAGGATEEDRAGAFSAFALKWMEMWRADKAYASFQIVIAVQLRSEPFKAALALGAAAQSLALVDKAAEHYAAALALASDERDAILAKQLANEVSEHVVVPARTLPAHSHRVGPVRMRWHYAGMAPFSTAFTCDVCGQSWSNVYHALLGRHRCIEGCDFDACGDCMKNFE